MSIICIGDSITFGYPSGPEFSWVERVRQRTGRHMINLGMNGSTSLYMLHNYEYYTPKEEATHVHILGGGNDPLQQLTWSETKRNMQSLIALAKERNAVPVIGLPTPCCYNPSGGGSFVPDYAMEPLILWKARYRDWLKEFSKEHSILLVDYYTPFCAPGSPYGDGKYFYDESHLSEEGNELMAKLVEQWVNDNIQHLFAG